MKDIMGTTIYDPICGTSTTFSDLKGMRQHLISAHSDCIINSAPSISNIKSQYGNDIKVIVSMPDITVAPIQSGFTPVGYDLIQADVEYEGLNPIMKETVKPDTQIQSMGTSGKIKSDIAKVWYYVKSEDSVVKSDIMNNAVKIVGVALVVGLLIWGLSKKNKETK